MSDTMGTFRIEIEVENPARPGRRMTLAAVLVDTGAELSWCPSDVLDALGIERRKLVSFRQADGSVLERWTGPAFIYAAGTTATDDVVFGERSDLVLLGARSLEGLNLRVDPVSKRLVDAGPVPAVAAPLPRDFREGGSQASGQPPYLIQSPHELSGSASAVPLPHWPLLLPPPPSDAPLLDPCCSSRWPRRRSSHSQQART